VKAALRIHTKDDLKDVVSHTLLLSVGNATRWDEAKITLLFILLAMTAAGAAAGGSGGSTGAPGMGSQSQRPCGTDCLLSWCAMVNGPFTMAHQAFTIQP